MPATSRRSVNNKKIICGQCELTVQENEGSIDCDKCNKSFHVVCTRLNKRQFNHLLAHEDEDFFCDFCVPNVSNNNNNANDSGSSLVTAELSAMRMELKTQLGEMREAMNFMSKQYDDILRGVADNKKKIEAVQKENKMLKAEINTMKESMKYINDQRVLNDCLVTGMKVSENESAVEAVMKLSSDAGVTLQPQAIADAYFLRRNNGNSQSVVIKFNSRKAKTDLMTIKPKLKEKEETKKVYVNDYLSRETLNLFKYAKVLKNIGFRSVYTSGSKVFAKRGELSKPRLLKSEADVDNLLSEAATYPKQQSRSRKESQFEEHSDNDYQSPS